MIQIHVDVDNLWMYEQEFGIKIHPDPEYIYTRSLPLFLKLLNRTKSKATFMIIGKDLQLKACQIFCQKAIAAGHEIANHTWTHPISFETLSYRQKEQQIIKTHEKIKEICGKSPIGFRGPGYYQDKEIITILENLGYQYDSSVLPGFAQFLMTTYATLKGGKNRHKTFGRTEYIFSKSNPYSIDSTNSGGKLWELPISVLPQVRLPIHTTFAYFFGSGYRQKILTYLKTKPKYILFLFHAIDFVDFPQNPNHPIIPLRYSFEERLTFIENILKILVQANKGPLITTRNYLNNGTMKQ